MADTKELVKERLGIVDTIQSYIKLQKAGVNFRARCPFHTEKTPSFFVSPSRNSFYCFGCGAKGDIFSFVERYEGVDFLGALKILAEKAGVPMVFEPKEKKDEKENLFSLMEAATGFYENNLQSEPAPREYLTSRGVSPETVKIFRLGYALPEWSSLAKHLEEKGFSEALIEKAGLTKLGNRGSYDRFRGRIMFPIFDVSGRPIAFSGRIFDSSVEGEGVTPAKYVNSPETPLYQKSKVLYGLNLAKEGIRKWTFSIVVEGQMDLIMSHQAGCSNTVALSGTALTPEQLTLLKRLSNRIVLSLDADVAGVSAVGKSASLALSEGFDVKVAHIKVGKDPADIVKENPAQWKETIKSAKHVIEFYLDVLKERNSDTRRFRLEVTKTVLPYVKKIKGAVDRAHFVSLISERLALPAEAVEKELQSLPEGGEVRAALEIKGLESTLLSRKDLILKTLIGFAKSHPKVIDESKVREKIAEFIGKENEEKLFSDEDFALEAAFAVEAAEENKDGPSMSADELLTHLELECLKEEREKVSQTLKQKEREKDEKELSGIMKNYQSISKKIAEVEEKIQQNNFQKNN